MVYVSRSYAAKLKTAGREPVCLDCSSPARTAEVEAEAVAWIRSLGDQAAEVADAVAALS